MHEPGCKACDRPFGLGTWVNFGFMPCSRACWMLGWLRKFLLQLPCLRQYGFDRGTVVHGAACDVRYCDARRMHCGRVLSD